MNSIEFHKRFPDDVTIYEYIANAKWATEDFTCRRCGYDKYCKGKKLRRGIVQYTYKKNS